MNQRAEYWEMRCAEKRGNPAPSQEGANRAFAVAKDGDGMVACACWKASIDARPRPMTIRTLDILTSCLSGNI